MKSFAHHAFSPAECEKQLRAFELLLASKPELKEEADVLPFFRTNLDLAAFVGTYVPDIATFDRVATEYDLFGDFACDLVVGDSVSRNYLFVEFEDGKPGSIFVTKRTKSTPEWAPSLERGFSQVLDWFWKLSDTEKSDDFENRFGARHVTVHGLVVVGRDQTLGARERNRLQWRQDHTVVHSKKVSLVTFDRLADDLKYRLTRCPQAAKVAAEIPDEVARETECDVGHRARIVGRTKWGDLFLWTVDPRE